MEEFTYPAVGSFAQLAGAVFPWGDYRASVREGVDELNAYLAQQTRDCPDETFVLGGYSQGAQVVGEGLTEMPRTTRDRIASTALFGDPRFSTGRFSEEGNFPVPCRNTPAWVRGDVLCLQGGGILGARNPYLPGDMLDRTGSWCRRTDAICTGAIALLPTSIFPVPGGSHYAYFQPGGEMAPATLEIAEHLATRLPEQADAFDITFLPIGFGVAGADLAFVIDTTGSMGGVLNTVRNQANQLAGTWVNGLPNARVGLVQYRDQFDAFTARTELDLTDDVAAFEAVTATLRAAGGGDRPEAVLSGILQALDTMSWQPGALKALVVIADAPGRDPEPGSGLTRDEIIARAVELNPVALIKVNTSNQSDVEAFFAPLAEGTGGRMLRSGPDLTGTLFEVLTGLQTKPVAVASGGGIFPTGTEITFSADGSRAVTGEIVRYRWDFDNDGTFDLDTDQPTVTHTYPDTYEGLAVLEVTDSEGRKDLAITEVIVDDNGLSTRLPIDVTAVDLEANGDGTSTVSWVAGDDDRADGYVVRDGDGQVLGLSIGSGSGSLVVDDQLLGSQATLHAVNGFGPSPGVELPLDRGEFSGFRPPVADPPEVNRERAGRTVPVRFSLGGDRGSSIFVEGSPTVTEVSCDDLTGVGDEELATTSNGTGLRYAPGADQYTFNWSTERSWAGSCRELRLTFRDGQSAVARFAFR